MSQAVETVPFMTWREFLAEFMMTWDQGEHLTITGPTGQGKSMLALELLKARARSRRSHIVILATKPKDPTLRRLNWPMLKTWGQGPGYGQDQVILWPPYGSPATAKLRQRNEFMNALLAMFKEGNRTVYFDEAGYFAEDLRMEPIMRDYWQQGRSMRLTVVAGTQRPVRVPRPMFSEASWFIAFRTHDEQELKRVAEIGGADTAKIRDAIRSLAPHEFLVVQTRTGAMVRSKVTR